MPASQNKSFDLIDLIGARLKVRGQLKNASIAWHCHLTSVTVAAATVATEAGARLFISEANSATTMQSALAGLKHLGVQVYTGPNCQAKVLAHKPLVIADTALVLTEEWLKSGGAVQAAVQPWPLGACEITANGIKRYHQLLATQAIPLPLININSSRLQSAVENFHGVGDGLMEALQLGTGLKKFTDNHIVVVGYGRVGSGCARYLKEVGARVEVVEEDPVQAVMAHYDGFKVTALGRALAEAEVLVTATGSPQLWQEQDFERARDGLVVVNVGHDRNEVAPHLWEKRASRVEVVNEVLTRYTFNTLGNKCLYLATDGNPANIALLTGSFEPMLILLATQLLTWEYLLESAGTLPCVELSVPQAVEEIVSRLTLQSLGYTA
jgi:adenosylhomocysteinase